MKTAELMHNDLNIAMHMALGWVRMRIHTDEDWVQKSCVQQAEETPDLLPEDALWRGPVPDYSHDWNVSGPLMDSCGIHTRGIVGGYEAWIPDTGLRAVGSWQLGAVCRCIVLKHLGRNVTLPKELA